MTFRLCATICWVGLLGPAAWAHVPYLETRDYSPEQPFAVGDVTQSKAVYAWLKNGGDVDVYNFEITAPTRLLVDVLVPVCPDYATFRPAYAIVGPGLPQPAEPIPYELPEGYGAIVVPPGDPSSWEVLYEPFGGKRYYDGPNFDQEISTPGQWSLVYWDPAGVGGDYVAAIGYEEAFSAADIIRSLIVTPLIRRDLELHSPCGGGSRRRRATAPSAHSAVAQ